MTVKTVSDMGRQRFQDARFGMFIHWGLYSLLGRGEWVMHNERIPVADYERLAARFKPGRFDAEEWAGLAADAGQKYIVITSRHHDGFSMYDTGLSEYKVTRTPFRRDPLAELANACARRTDPKLGFYVSLLDWHHPAYRFRDQSGLAWADYLGFLHGQVRELCTRFGEVACIWFDGDWPRQALDDTNRYFAAGGSFEYQTLYDLVHTLQPDAVIHNNRHAQPLPGEDAQGFEQDLPGANSAGFNTLQTYDLPMEVCMTINDNWGVHMEDDNHKSTRRLVHNLIRCASLNANYLLNVGPTAEGEILPVQAQRLRQIGDWLRANGESIYGARAGVAGVPDGVSTRRGGVHFVHALNYNADRVYVDGLPDTVSHASLLRDGTTLDLRQAGARRYVVVPADRRDPLATVIRLE